MYPDSHQEITYIHLEYQTMKKSIDKSFICEQPTNAGDMLGLEKPARRGGGGQ